MKKIFLAIAITIFLTGCTWPEKTYDTAEFKAVKQKFENQIVRLKGEVSYKSNCPVCPNQNGCAPCPKYIFLTNAFDKPSAEQTVVAINFPENKAIGEYYNLKIGDSVTLRARFRVVPEGNVIANEIGYFEYENLVK